MASPHRKRFNIEVVVDRIEGAFAVLDVDGTTVNWPVSALPAVSESDVLAIQIHAKSGPEPRSRNLRSGPDGNEIDL